MIATAPATATLITSAEMDWARAARSAYPEITNYGFPGTGLGFMENIWEEELDEISLQQVVVSRRWLELCTPWTTRASTMSIGSYSAKHRAERWSKMQKWGPIYVREGSLILAALALQVPIKRYGNHTWGAYLGISRQGLRCDKPDRTCLKY